MTNKTSPSSQQLNNPESGVTDSPWQPSWWRWLLSALSGTVEIEKQHAKRQRQHEQRMKELREDSEKYSAMPTARSFDLRAADEERNRAAEERERAARRARIQNRGAILQIRYQLEPNPANGQALRDFLAFLQEYGE